MKGWPLFVIILLMCLMSFIGGWRCGSDRRTAIVPSNVPDTIVRYDTVTIEKPVPTKTTTIRRDTILLSALDTLTIRDTVFLTLPMEVKQYQDSLYRAEVSGYRPSLDFIEVYPRTVTVTNTNTVVKTRKTRWGLGVQAGYGVTLHNNEVFTAPYVGLGVSYSLFSW